MAVQWNDLFAALAIVCVIEGIMPFMSPERTKRLLVRMAALEDREMRMMALVSMVLGLAVLFAVRSP